MQRALPHVENQFVKRRIYARNEKKNYCDIITMVWQPPCAARAFRECLLMMLRTRSAQNRGKSMIWLLWERKEGRKEGSRFPGNFK
jgi:hypothetical protein